MKRHTAADRADAARTLGRHREAARLATEALAQDPDDLEARYTLGRALWQLDDLDEAETVARELLRRDPEDPWHHNLLGDVLLTQPGRQAPERALPHYREAHRRRSSSPGLAYDLADVLWRLDRHDEAARVLDRVLNEKPEEADLLALRARVAEKLGHRRDAARFSRRALRLDPEAPETHDARGTVAYALGCYRVAERHYRETRRLDPATFPWLQAQLIRETRYLQSPWYVATLVPACLVFAAPWPWKALTIAAAGLVGWWGWPVTGYLVLINVALFVSVRGFLRWSGGGGRRVRTERAVS
ncbi:MAG: tetratricopeptide repeat protein [Planctomycetota bacterium]